MNDLFYKLKMQKTVRFVFILSIVLVIFLAGALTGYFVRINLSHTESAEFEDLFQPFYQTWNIIHNQYLEQPVDDTLLMQGAIRGMMDSLGDPYTSYMDPEEYQEQNAPLKGEYTGIGAWVDTTGDALVFVSPMPDSPAEAAGIQPGDEVVMIDGEDMTEVEPDLVLKRILGPAGTKVNLTIKREGAEEYLEFEIERAVITIPSVEQEMLENETGYIHLYSFSSNSAAEFKSAFESLLDEGATKLIVDLRSNSGGFVDTAVDITSTFLPSGTILIEEWGDGTRNEYVANEDPIDIDIPLVILVDAGSASASEIMAGALQDYERATLIGTSTFGKGLIQNWIPLVNDSGAVRVTIARWLTPEEQQIQDNGLNPDILVEFTEEDIEAGIDVQLGAALDFLTDSNATTAESDNN
jgi:carboxyl-terminal processing protease